ncbi:MAG: ACR3 family arsenite efflux transporter [Tetragenococcus halophilus]|uniref:Arsenical-resistance protein n=1 Tax=Tetragenococcus halophilus TaxID=51669 RepID=A0A3G5FI68_TETHA|nr:ACR3 family arsenite efflux transporter [Tetragenococcus halophilus]MDN6181985.1 ACR3 family arsenite efflux transporter [Staphylococcus equorum]AYW49935.1 arsenical-resistance protein [Tetragenococcus halophilus]MCO8288689.1 ACR3 family arsenite efflux transporter [Tetragenococcus halophilus]MCO8288696.1 ACR3 family arsenite efflux transporter [Tetragenococcus halophilus]MDN6129482.1 ACR3 family arsenite efflux transporter [Tetragenococcus halophilus]
MKNDIVQESTSQESGGMGLWERYLSLWVALAMIAGVLLSQLLPAIPEFLNQFEYYNVSIPTAILIWLMIFPMMLKIDFSSLLHAGKKPKGLMLTTTINWLVKPFTMFAISAFFFLVVFRPFLSPELAREYIAGAVLLGAAPCTAMVFVWSSLTKGDPAYTLLQVSVNDVIVLFLYAPIVALLLGVGNVSVPMGTLFLSIFVFIVIPLVLGIVVRKYVVKNKGKNYFENTFVNKFDGTTRVGLLLTLVIIFSFQGDQIINNPFHILLIAIPLIIQNIAVFFLGYGGAKACKLPFSIAVPAAMVGTSNFFELAVAVSVSLFGLNSGATLATVVGVLIEVPTMLLLVKFSNKTKHWFDGYEY